MSSHEAIRKTDAELSELLAQNTAGVRRLLDALHGEPVVLPATSRSVRSRRMTSDLERLRVARDGSRRRGRGCPSES